VRLTVIGDASRVDVNAENRSGRAAENRAAVSRAAPSIENQLVLSKRGGKGVDRFVRNEKVVSNAGPHRLVERTQTGRDLSYSVHDATQVHHVATASSSAASARQREIEGISERTKSAGAETQVRLCKREEPMSERINVAAQSNQRGARTKNSAGSSCGSLGQAPTIHMMAKAAMNANAIKQTSR
jgi:hypothetical protein